MSRVFGVVSRIVFCSYSIALFAQGKPASSDNGTIQRRVLVFDFENETGKVEFDYLSGSIADALADAIKKTGKFRLMNRDDARTNTVADVPPATAATPQNTTAESAKKEPMVIKVHRKDAIKRGHDSGADVVVFGKFSELNGVLLMSAQAYEADTRLLKVSEDILTRSDSEMFNGINELAKKIAESMARELPMFDPVEAELRRQKALRSFSDERDWELQFLAGLPLMTPLYSSDGTLTYDKGFPVNKLSGYSFGLGFWNRAWAKKIFFMPKDARLGVQAKATLTTGNVDMIGANATSLAQGAPVASQFYSAVALMGFPYYQNGRFAAFAEIGGGALYGIISNNSTIIFATTMPGAVVGTSVAYHWPYWSLGVSYRAQVWFLSSYNAFLQQDFLLFAGVRL
ncbi:MAG: hypothetical protein JSR44_06930 [Spirochaetes bacterium]|nr:hypothetical protein [Spirochaetota bacterium]